MGKHLENHAKIIHKQRTEAGIEPGPPSHFCAWGGEGGGVGGCSTKGGNSGSSPLRIRTRSYQEVKAYHKRKHTRAAERTFVCEASSLS